LNRDNDPFLVQWEKDLTSRKSRVSNLPDIDLEKQKEVEKKVTRYIQESFSFVVFPLDLKESRLELESKMISTVSLCDECVPSKNWLGRFSPREKIKESGLWLVNELYKTPMSSKDIWDLRHSISV
jgi:hypothetical protein